MILNNLKEKSLIKINQLNLRQSIFNLREDTQITLASLPQWKKGSPISEKNIQSLMPSYSLKSTTLRIFFLHILAKIAVIDVTDGIMKNKFIKASKTVLLLSEKKIFV